MCTYNKIVKFEVVIIKLAVNIFKLTIPLRPEVGICRWHSVARISVQLLYYRNTFLFKLDHHIASRKVHKSVGHGYVWEPGLCHGKNILLIKYFQRRHTI
jgi:hypothetical protein